MNFWDNFKMTMGSKILDESVTKIKKSKVIKDTDDIIDDDENEEEEKKDDEMSD